MNNKAEKPKFGSDHKIHLPAIAHSKSMPLVQNGGRKEEFDLRFVNEQMPVYDPNKDRFLNAFFMRHSRERGASTSQKVRKAVKTEPSQSKQKRPQLRRQKLLTLQSQKKIKQNGVKEISKQQFGNFMQMMKEKLKRT